MLNIINCDCMDLMKEYPDKYFELAIVDPPYGIGASEGYSRSLRNNQRIKEKTWDNEGIPKPEYFNELFRVSTNQIIWGGNYFALHPTRCFIVWDKVNAGRDFADCEMAWTSFDMVARMFQYRIANDHKQRIHPTQKPVALYEWLLTKYAKKGDKILDTHMGSGSIAIACHNLGFDLTACELDKDYYDAAMKRIEFHRAQKRLF